METNTVPEKKRPDRNRSAKNTGVYTDPKHGKKSTGNYSKRTTPNGFV